MMVATSSDDSIQQKTPRGSWMQFISSRLLDFIYSKRKKSENQKIVQFKMKISSLTALILGVQSKNCCKVWQFEITHDDEWLTLQESYTCTYNPEISQQMDTGGGWIYTCDDEHELFIGRDYWDGSWAIHGNAMFRHNTNYDWDRAESWYFPEQIGTDDWSECMVNDFQTSLGTATAHFGYNSYLLHGSNFRCTEEEYTATTTIKATTTPTTTRRASTTMEATTTTTAAAATTTTAKSPSDWLSELLANVESELNIWGGRPKLFKTWVKRINKFDERFLEMKNQGCDFPNRWVPYDLDQGNVCDVSFKNH